MKCPRCGITVNELPEDSTYEEALCNQCYEEAERESMHNGGD